LSIERTVFIPDAHEPYAHARAMAAVLDAVDDLSPKRVVVMGDLLDFGPVSRYEQDPRLEESIQEHLDAGESRLVQIRSAVGRKAEIVYLEGNHEHRLTKYLIRHAGKLMALKRAGEEVLSVPFLLDLKRKGVLWVPEDRSYRLHDYLVEHGDCASSQSAYTARRMVEKRMTNVVHGHTHRMGSYWKTGAGNVLHGIELGCLIDPESEAAAYARMPNWQLGFGVGEYDTVADFFQVTPVWIKDRKFLINNRLYAA
jgi:UDP-2,3-diacylglucosamine pyrophosphatase LpxH